MVACVQQDTQQQRVSESNPDLVWAGTMARGHKSVNMASAYLGPLTAEQSDNESLRRLAGIGA